MTRTGVIILTIVAIIFAGLAWFQFGGGIGARLSAARDALLKANVADRTVIDSLKGENATAREEIVRLKETARQAESRAQAWQAQAAKHQAQANDFKAQRDKLTQERAALKHVTTAQEAISELKRLGF